MKPACETCGRPFGRPLPPLHWDKVASIYRTAITDGVYPTLAVQQAFGCPRSTAGRWVLEARRRGHLEPPPKHPATNR